MNSKCQDLKKSFSQKLISLSFAPFKGPVLLGIKKNPLIKDLKFVTSFFQAKES